MVIECTEDVIYKTLIEIAQLTPGPDSYLFVPILKHNLNEEIYMEQGCTENMPKMVDKLLREHGCG